MFFQVGLTTFHAIIKWKTQINCCFSFEFRCQAFRILLVASSVSPASPLRSLSLCPSTLHFAVQYKTQVEFRFSFACRCQVYKAQLIALAVFPTERGMSTASASMQVRRRRLFSCTSPRDFCFKPPVGGPRPCAKFTVPYCGRHCCYHRAMQSALFFGLADDLHNKSLPRFLKNFWRTAVNVKNKQI